ncbi:hypothetical protein NUW58_g4864 [Xylaria curta]|uniref:Uncharacterized protein n=1 Tax=Xylaria curta TaxID=42375 RepID=A0ACC1P5T1_9PEZI|nr:hypothetical protein NUW58_g4864 [Xylaria curta]
MKTLNRINELGRRAMISYAPPSSSKKNIPKCHNLQSGFSSIPEDSSLMTLCSYILGCACTANLSNLSSLPTNNWDSSGDELTRSSRRNLSDRGTQSVPAFDLERNRVFVCSGASVKTHRLSHSTSDIGLSSVPLSNPRCVVAQTDTQLTITHQFKTSPHCLLLITLTTFLNPYTEAMPPMQQPSVEIGRRVAMLRELLQQSKSSKEVALLVTAMTAQNVDIHERTLTELADRLQQMEAALSSDSEDTARHIQELRRAIEHDAKDLRELIQANEQSIDARADQDKLYLELAEVVKQHGTAIAGFRQVLQTTHETIEAQQQTANEVKESLGTVVQRMKSSQSNLNKLKDNLKQNPSTTAIIERIMMLEERVAERFNVVKAVGSIQLPPVSIDETLSCGRAVENATDQPPNENTEKQPHNENAGERPPNDACTSSSTAQKRMVPAAIILRDWPAIARFIDTYKKFKGIYISNKPKSPRKFIGTFLSELNVHVSCFFQRHLLKIYPQKVALIASDFGEPSPNIFIKLGGLTWNDIRRALPALRDWRAIQWAFDEGMSGPPNLVSVLGSEEHSEPAPELPITEQNLLTPPNNLTKLEPPAIGMDQEQITPPVMGMTAKEYQTAFAYLDHANFAREMEEYKGQQRRGSGAGLPRGVPYYKRYEFWAIVLGLASLVHAVFVQWVWPFIRAALPPNSPLG